MRPNAIHTYWNIFRSPSGYFFIESYPTGVRTEESIVVAEVASEDQANLIVQAPRMLNVLMYISNLLGGERDYRKIAPLRDEEIQLIKDLIKSTINATRGNQ